MWHGPFTGLSSCRSLFFLLHDLVPALFCCTDVAVQVHSSFGCFARTKQNFLAKDSIGRDPSWTSFSKLNAPWLEAAVGRGGEALRACIVCTESLGQFDRWNLVWGKRFY